VSLSLTTKYIRQHLQVRNICLAAMGFYLYLLSKPKGERKIPRYQILEELKTGKDQLYKYTRELASIGVLETESVPGQSTEYIPYIYSKDDFKQKNGVLELRTSVVKGLSGGLEALIKPSNTIHIHSDQTDQRDQSDHSDRSSRGALIKDKDELTDIVKKMNKHLPRDERVIGKVPNTYQKKLLTLHGKVDIEDYTKWFVKEKLLSSKSDIYAFGWKIFLYKTMPKEYLKVRQLTGERKAVLQTTSKWKGSEGQALKRAQKKLSKIKKVKQ